MRQKKKDNPSNGKAFRIIGKNCGRDKHGTFHCTCVRCRPISLEVGKYGEYARRENGIYSGLYIHDFQRSKKFRWYCRQNIQRVKQNHCC